MKVECGYARYEIYKNGIKINFLASAILIQNTYMYAKQTKKKLTIKLTHDKLSAGKHRYPKKTKNKILLLYLIQYKYIKRINFK